MPLTKKGRKIMKNMTKQYCDKDSKEPCKKAKEVFYASENKGSIKGLHESIEKFILSFENESNKELINTVLEGFNTCFEAEENEVLNVPDNPEETEETQRKLEELKRIQSDKESLKEEEKGLVDELKDTTKPEMNNQQNA